MRLVSVRRGTSVKDPSSSSGDDTNSSSTSTSTGKVRDGGTIVKGEDGLVRAGSRIEEENELNMIDEASDASLSVNEDYK